MNNIKIKGIPINWIIFTIVGLILIIRGFIKDYTLYNLEMLTGMFSLLFVMYLINSHNIKKLEEKLNEK